MPPVKRVLMIAYHFPPMSGSSGIHRTLGFVRDLEAFGWQRMVLTTRPSAYDQVSDDLMKEVPDTVPVHRAFALDTARHLALFNRYPLALALPDRWVSWLAGAIPTGLRMIRAHKPDVLWSTYPIATAHLIGAALARLTGIPWVADFRDPMAHEGYPPEPRVWRSYLKVEKRVFARACRITFTTPGAMRFYCRRYPGAASRCTVVQNGYDERSFDGLQDAASHAAPLNPGRLTLLHSGVVYPAHRSPEHLFGALRGALDAGLISADRIRVRFRAPVHEQFVHELTAQYGLDGIVELLPAVGYREALREMIRADGLIVLQSADCNDQIPAKVYEYMRAGRPVIGLTDDAGATAAVLRDAGLRHIAALDSTSGIQSSLLAFLAEIEAETAPRASQASVESSSRRGSARALSEVLDQARKERCSSLSKANGMPTKDRP